MYKWPVSDVNDINIFFFNFFFFTFIDTSYKRHWDPGSHLQEKPVLGDRGQVVGTTESYKQRRHTDTKAPCTLRCSMLRPAPTSYFHFIAGIKIYKVTFAHNTCMLPKKFSEHQRTALSGKFGNLPKFSLRSCDTRFSTGWQCGPFVLCGDSSPAGLTLHIQYEPLCALVVGQWNLRIRLVLPVRGHTQHWSLGFAAKCTLKL